MPNIFLNNSFPVCTCGNKCLDCGLSQPVVKTVCVGPGAVRPQLLQPDWCFGDEPAEWTEQPPAWTRCSPPGAQQDQQPAQRCTDTHKHCTVSSRCFLLLFWFIVFLCLSWYQDLRALLLLLSVQPPQAVDSALCPALQELLGRCRICVQQRNALELEAKDHKAKGTRHTQYKQIQS